VPPTEAALLWLFTDDPAAGLLAGIGCIQHPKVIALRAFEKLADESFGPEITRVSLVLSPHFGQTDR
jgi:hypothetical protein